MRKPLNLSGVRFSMLVALEVDANHNGRRKWVCKCDCGATTTVATSKLTSGHTKSCGCLRVITGKQRTTHGMRSFPEYQIWSKMKSRCQRPSDPSYKTYGARGIAVCDEWEDFEVFIRDLGRRPSDKHTLERINVNSGYNKENVIWTDDMCMQSFNQNRKSNNTSGRSGVYWVKTRKRWVAQTHHNGTCIRHGSFINKEDAIAARKHAEISIYGMEKPDGLV